MSYRKMASDEAVFLFDASLPVSSAIAAVSATALQIFIIVALATSQISCYPLVRMTERTFQVLEHTADKGVAATGKSLAEAFENIAYGMFSLFVDPSAYKAIGERELVLTADDREQLLWTWLSELVYIFAADGQLPVEFHVLENDDTSLKASIEVRPIGEDIEWLGSEVKAVTFHQIKAEQRPDGWYVQVYVDV